MNFLSCQVKFQMWSQPPPEVSWPRRPLSQLPPDPAPIMPTAGAELRQAKGSQLAFLREWKPDIFNFLSGQTPAPLASRLFQSESLVIYEMTKAFSLKVTGMAW